MKPRRCRFCKRWFLPDCRNPIHLFSQAVSQETQASGLAPMGDEEQTAEAPEAADLGESVSSLLAALPQNPRQIPVQGQQTPGQTAAQGGQKCPQSKPRCVVVKNGLLFRVSDDVSAKHIAIAKTGLE